MRTKCTTCTGYYDMSHFPEFTYIEYMVSITDHTCMTYIKTRQRGDRYLGGTCGTSGTVLLLNMFSPEGQQEGF